jgi:hypothetical protein
LCHIFLEPRGPVVAVIDETVENLVGSTISKCHVLKDIDDTFGMFFIFAGAGVVSVGTYRLKIVLTNVDLYVTI